ncbi:GntR family transcriptional regulator [Polymorphospora sp. NPDC050346]|uniref:GntR family transcriptional regulator n=1 Tax=Polymorphospora sp. NPDC050346 TaxID=3155780 RepID=UPI0033DAB975
MAKLVGTPATVRIGRADRTESERAGASARAAGRLREMIRAGRIRPGDRLSEEEWAGALEVSRNTLREAFRLLGHEKLVVHELNRGVSVRRLGVDDVIDIYRVRRLVECAAVGRVATATPADLGRLRAAVAEGDRAAACGEWLDVGTANIHFHQAIAALLGSPRVDETMGQILAELRLAFHAMPDERAFHLPYVGWNRRLFTLIVDGGADAAGAELEIYLAAAERQLVGAYPAGR